MGQQGDLAYDAEMVPWTVMSCRETGFHQPQIVLEVLRVSQELYSEDISHSQPGHLLGDRGLPRSQKPEATGSTMGKESSVVKHQNQAKLRWPDFFQVFRVSALIRKASELQEPWELVLCKSLHTGDVESCCPFQGLPLYTLDSHLSTTLTAAT